MRHLELYKIMYQLTYNSQMNLRSLYTTCVQLSVLTGMSANVDFESVNICFNLDSSQFSNFSNVWHFYIFIYPLEQFFLYVKNNIQ